MDSVLGYSSSSNAKLLKVFERMSVKNAVSYIFEL